jgi:hypothetical protein
MRAGIIIVVAAIPSAHILPGVPARLRRQVGRALGVAGAAREREPRDLGRHGRLQVEAVVPGAEAAQGGLHPLVGAPGRRRGLLAARRHRAHRARPGEPRGARLRRGRGLRGHEAAAAALAGLVRTLHGGRGRRGPPRPLAGQEGVRVAERRAPVVLRPDADHPVLADAVVLGHGVGRALLEPPLDDLLDVLRPQEGRRGHGRPPRAPHRPLGRLGSSSAARLGRGAVGLHRVVKAARGI